MNTTGTLTEREAPHMADALIRENVAVLQQAQDVLARLDASTYAGTDGLPVASGPGGHIRHCLDFYDSFLRGLAAARVDYNVRERDERTASDPQWAIARIEATILALESLPAPGPAAHLLVRGEGPGGAADVSSWGRSSAVRELQVLLSHTIHHFALIALVLRLQGIEPGEEFGVAPSTLEYWRTAV